MTASIAQNRVAGAYGGRSLRAPSATYRSETKGDFSIGNSSGFGAIDTDGNVGLVLNQMTTISSSVEAAETVTFNFSRTVTSVSFRVYDMTRQTGSGSNNYTDALSFNKPTTLTISGDTAGANARLRTTLSATSATSQTTGSLSNYVYRSGDFQTITTGDRNVDVVVTVNGTSFQMSYRNVEGVGGSAVGNTNDYRNQQWIVIGDLTVCA